MTKIGAPTVSIEGDLVRYCAAVDDTELRLTAQKEFAPLVSATADAALVAMLYPSMLRGENLHVEGQVSEKLLYNATGPLQALLSGLNPNLKRIRVTATGTVRLLPAGGCATGFSAGVDSFSIIKRHFMDNPTSGYKITHLTLHDIWSAERSVDFQSPNLLKGMKDNIALAAKWGLPIVTISSNVGAFYKGIRFEDTHTIRNSAAAHFIGRGVGRFIYASAYPLEKLTYTKVGDIARADAALLPMLSSDSVDCISGDADKSRFEKTRGLTTVPETYQYLHVCAESWDYNCSVCWKCRRTLLTLDVLGEIEKYRPAFNIDRFKEDKDKWLGEMLTKNDIFIDEIVDYARRNRIPLQTPSLLAAKDSEPPYA